MIAFLSRLGWFRPFGSWYSPACAAVRERGSALVEVVMLTTPISIVCIVAASALYATSSTHLASRAQADLTAQQLTTQPCGGPTLEAAAWSASSPIKSFFTYPVAKIGLSITETDRRTAIFELPVRDFALRGVADRMLRQRPNRVESRMTYGCNEPEHGGGRQPAFEIPLGAIGTATATGLY